MKKDTYLPDGTTSPSPFYKTRNPQWAKIASGSIGSLITAVAVHPLEVLKVRRQASKTNLTPNSLPKNVTLCPQGCGTFVINNGLGDCTLPRKSVPYFDLTTGNFKSLPDFKAGSKTFRTFRRIFMENGVKGLYAGLLPSLTMGVPNTVIYFLTYDALSAKIKSIENAPSWTAAVAGASARCLATFSTAPLELIRTIQASRTGADQPSRGMIGEFQSIWKNGGFFSLYKGLSPTLSRDVPFSAIYWYCIESCRTRWVEYDSSREVYQVSTQQQAARALFNGSVSGLIAAFFTTPLDVVKTRRQLQVDPLSLTEPTAAHLCDHKGHIVYQKHTSGTFELLHQILREEGLQGLFKGNVARLTKVAPACACMIASYEVGQRIFLDDD